MATSPYRSNLYGDWQPENHSGVWVGNAEYAQMQRDLAKARRNGGKADPREVLALLDRIMRAWDRERTQACAAFDDLVAHYNEAIRALHSNEREINELRKTLNRLRRELNSAIERQNRLTEQIDEINRRKQQASLTAAELRNTLVEEFNSVANGPIFNKFAPDGLQKIISTIQKIDSGALSDDACQALAVNGSLELNGFRSNVERESAEFRLHYIIARDQVKAISEQYAHWRDEIYFDAENKHHIDMNYWSHGRFSQAEGNLRNLEARIVSGELASDYFTAQLKEDMETLTRLRDEGEQIFAEVLNRTNLSEYIEAMGRLTALVLCEDFGFRLVTIGFNNDDDRDAYVVQMDSPQSLIKIQFVFTPMSPTDSLCTYNISYGAYVDEKLADVLLQRVLAQLQANNISFTVGRNRAEDIIVDDIPFSAPGKTIHLPDSSAQETE